MTWLFRLLLLLNLVATPAMAEEPVTLRVMSFNVWYGGDQVSIVKVAEAIRAADADIVGLQESDGQLFRIAELAGLPYVDQRRRIISRFPIFDSGSGVRTDKDVAPYSLTALDRNAIAAWIMIRPGKVVAMSNVHLSSDPSGLEKARTGGTPGEVLAMERAGRLPEAEPLAALGKLAASGTPVFLTGDFNAPSHLDWTAAAARDRHDFPYPLTWPVSAFLAASGLRDSYREAHPDAGRHPGLTWTPGTPSPVQPTAPGRDRIDFIYAAGDSRTVASQVVGEPGGPDVDIAIFPWPADHRAVVSTFAVTPIDAPPLIDVGPRVAMAGESIMIRTFDPTGPTWTAWIVPRGAGPDKAITGVKAMTAEYQRALRLSTHGLAPGDYDALLVGKDGAVIARNGFSIVPAGAKPALAIAGTGFPAGTAIPVRWENAPGDLRDWLAVFRAGDPDATHYLAFAYTDARAAGTVAVPVDLPPGRYEMRLLHDEIFVTLATAGFEIR